MISVVVTCHNYGKYLQKCVESILDNDKSFLREIIIINDSSKDNTEYVAKKLKKKQRKLNILKRILIL